MNCKNISKILIASVLFTAGTAMAADIKITDVNLKNDTVTVTGTVDEAGRQNIALYAVSDVENPDDSDVAYAVQTQTDEDGVFHVSFTMNEQHSSADGKYIVYAICDDAKKPAEGSFEHIGKVSRQTVLDGFNGAVTKADIRVVMENNTEICKTLGISDLADVSEEYLDNRPDGGYTDENFVSGYNSLVMVKLVNDSDDKDEVKEYLDIFASLITDRDKENEDFISKVIFDNKKYENISEINEQYGKGVILCLINGSERDVILGNITEYSELLGIADNSSLKEYEKSGNEKKAYISKSLVVEASKNPFENGNDITDAIKSAINSFEKSDSQSSGSGGGGGSRGGSSSMSISTPEVGQKLENNIDSKVRFSDVSDDFWGREAIEKLADEGIVKGDGEKFRPDDKISREEFVTIAVNAFKLYNPDAECEFYDVPEGAWYYKYVASAYENNIISGMGDGVFGTGNSITREDAAVILSRLLEGDGGEPDFTDNNMISDYAEKGVGLMQRKNIITGMPDGSFAPKNNCTRAEAVMMFYKILSSGEALKI